MVPPVPSPEVYAEAILKGDRAMLGRAITLVESHRPADQEDASRLIKLLLVHTGKSMRVAISGVPGVGKSTFIEALGMHLTQMKKRVAVLAVDPSSLKTGGSILGDKTRMDELSKDTLAFVRPTPARGHLGGVGARTREAMLLCEAAGYEIILVETVGVGQSEIQVGDMVDYLVQLMLPGAGDELQGVKKGILEWSHLIVVNKCDGDNVKAAMKARTELQQALHLLGRDNVKVLTASALERSGIGETWEAVHTFIDNNRAAIQDRRRDQNLVWMEERLHHIFNTALRESVALSKKELSIKEEVRSGSIYPPDAARELWDALRGEPD